MFMCISIVLGLHLALLRSIYLAYLLYQKVPSTKGHPVIEATTKVTKAQYNHHPRHSFGLKVTFQSVTFYPLMIKVYLHHG